MDVEDQVVARIEPPWHALRLDQCRRIRLPEEEVAVGIEGVAGIEKDLHARDAGLPIGGMLLAKAAGAIDQHVGVMHDLRRAGADLHGANIVALLERIGQDEVAEDIRAASREA